MEKILPMQDSQTRILFLSKHPVHPKMAMAGNQFFYQTLLSFCKDERFKVGFATVQKQNEDFAFMRSSFDKIAEDFSMKLPKWLTVFTYLFYQTKWRNFLSFYRPDWYLLDPIYRYFFKKSIKKVQKEQFQPDIIVLEWTEVLFLASYCKKKFPLSKLVVTEHDVSFTKIERKFMGQRTLEKKLVAPFKQKELEALSEVDIIRGLSKDDRNTLIENHVEADKIRIVAPFFQKKNKKADGHYKNQVVFYGALGREENKEAVRWFIDHVFIPYHLIELIDFVIVGGGNRELKEQYKNISGIRFTGFVEDPSTIFVESLCMVVPLVNGGGIKIKVLEGMTCSLPVLTNNIGIEGIGGSHEIEYWHCDRPEDYSKGIQKLLQDPHLRMSMGENARKWINTHFDYEKDLIQYKNELIKITSTQKERIK